MSVPVSIIIVSWNVREQLSKCLTSVIAEEPEEIIVVDNNSADGSVELVQHNFPSIKLLPQSNNLGFARAVNLGVKETSQEIILVLNPDTQVFTGSLKLAVDFFTNHKQAGIMGGRLQNLDGSIQKSVRLFPTLWSQVAVLLKLSYLWPRLLFHYLCHNFDYEMSQLVDQVSGAFFFVRRSCWQKLIGFDEGFYIWFEEVDLCKRAKSLGWEVWFEPSVQAIHLGGQSFIQLNHQTRQSIFNHSLIYYFYKHHSLGAYFVIKVCAILSLGQAIILDFTRTLWTKVE